MRNSRVKNHRQTIAFMSPDNAYAQSNQCPEAYQLASPTNHNIKKNNYESNYNFFQTRINQQQKEVKKPQKQQFHRYASMDNSRTSMINFNQQQQPIISSLSSPYLLHTQALVKQNNFDQRPKMIAVSENFSGLRSSQQTNFGKQKKLSMKNTFANNVEKNYSIKVTEQACSVQDSGISTQYDSIKSRKNAQELLKFLSSKMEKPLQVLKQQISEQERMIKILNQKIESLKYELRSKEEQIQSLKSSTSQRNFSEKTDKIKQNQKKSNDFKSNEIQKLKNKIIRLEEQNQNYFQSKFYQQSQVQARLNHKIDEVMSYAVKILQTKTQNNQQKFISEEALKSIKDLISCCQNKFTVNRAVAKEIQQMALIGKNIREECYLIKNFIEKLSKNKEESIHFADLSSFQQKTKRPSIDLNDSASYFFHPSELSNIDKITELFINRQGKPIQCYVDGQNQVKYRDTNTFMFNKKGDIVRLTESEKKYYMDKGFISGNK